MEDTKPTNDKSQGPKKLFRSRSLKSVGHFMQRILRTLSSLSHLGDGERGNPDLEDDDGGFRQKSHPGELGRGVPQEDMRVVQGGDSNNNLGKAQGAPRGQEMPSWNSEDKVPGVLGLKNHGNTCFMNAVVQCLSNTDLLAEYLGMEQYRTELGRARVNGLVQKDPSEEMPGHGGRAEVTERLASLVRALWTLEYTPQLSVEFKNAVSKYGSQFRGNSQHDALEFLLWLLDRVHEDLNVSSGQKAKASAKPPASEQSGLGSPPSSPSDGGHSFVQDHFQAQYRSSLTCPHCHKQSDTFDPFLCVSLPIPLRQTRALNVTLVFLSKQQRFLRVGLAVPLLGTVAALRQLVADEGKIPADQVILAELYSSGFQRSFSDNEDVNAIAEGDPIYAFQVPLPLPKAPGSCRTSGYPHSLPSSPRSFDKNSTRLSGGGSVSSEFLASNSKILLLLCNLDGSGQQGLRFGPPLVLREDRTVSWDQLQQSILEKTHYLMRSDANLSNSGVLFHIRVGGAPASNCYLSAKDTRPLQHAAIDRALQLCGSGGPPHVKLAVEWDSKTKERLFGAIQEEVVRDDESVRTQQLDHQQQSCTLDECFQLYTKEEQLAPDDAWRCPHCKVLQQGTVKLSLWTLPDILIIHLKRFRQVGGRRNKLSTLVRFPLTGMDMAPHVVKRGQGGKGPVGQWSSWKMPPCQMDGSQLDVLYDLYAVCNHHGSLQGGHYTAYCRNSLDARWYSYDDSNVEMVQEDEVSTRGAYLLFYQKRNAIPGWSASSSVRGSTSSSMSDHWVLRLNGSKRESLVSRATTNCSPLPQIPDSEVFLEEENLDQGCVSKSFVRGVKGRSASMKLSSASKLKQSLSKAIPLRWSFGAKDRAKPKTGELVEYLESGRRPKYTNDSIVPLMTTVPNTENSTSGPQPKVSHVNTHGANGNNSASGQSRPTTSSKTDLSDGKLREKVCRQDSSAVTVKGDGPSQPQHRTSGVNSQSSLDSVEKVRANLGKRGDGNQRILTKEGDSSRPRTSETGHQEGKSAKPGILKKESRRPSASENIKQELHNGTSRTSLSNGVLADGRTSGTMPRRQKEDLTPSKAQMDIRRAHSSTNVQNKVEWTMKRSVSLYKNGSASHQASRPPAAEKSSSGTLQRMKSQTSSLGRKKTVPESSF